VSYEIKEVSVVDETLITKVEYTLTDNTKVEVDVPHFQPANKAAVITGIENRAISEQAKYDAAQLNLTIKTELESE